MMYYPPQWWRELLSITFMFLLGSAPEILQFSKKRRSITMLRRVLDAETFATIIRANSYRLAFATLNAIFSASTNILRHLNLPISDETFRDCIPIGEDCVGLVIVKGSQNIGHCLRSWFHFRKSDQKLPKRGFSVHPMAYFPRIMSRSDRQC